MKNFILIAFLISAVFSLGACSQSGSNSEAHDSPKKTYEGDVFEKAQEIYRERNADSFYECDRNQIPLIFEITKTLEDQREKIIELNKKRLADLSTEDIHRYKIGPHEFYDLVQNEEPKDKWLEYRDSWQEIIQLYKKVEKDPENEEWTILNTNVRSIIVDDFARLDLSAHHNVQRQLKTTILDTYNILKKCDENPTCTIPEFTEITLSWLTSDIYYKFMHNKLKDNDLDFSKKRKWLNYLKMGINNAFEDRFGFEKNKSLKVDNNKFILPLNLDIFSEGLKQAQELLETSWSKFGILLQIVPTSHVDDIFRITISNKPGERAFVSYKEKILQLYSPTRSSTLKLLARIRRTIKGSVDSVFA